MKRRLFVSTSLAVAGASVLASCSKIALVTNGLNDNPTIHNVLGSAQVLNHAVIGTHGMARVYADADVDANFRTNGLSTPSNATYAGLLHDNFRSYRLRVDGLVDRPQTFDLAHLRAIKNIDEATRHDCVEGWSAIGKFGGVRLSTILGMVSPKPAAKYVVFNCFDVDEQGTPFYGSISVGEAQHPQTMLALDLNDRPIDADHGGPVRLKIPTQLAYKSTKWVKSITLADSFVHIFGGAGGYWEDNGYEWYAGI